MAVKVNLVIDDKVKADLDELTPAGERSRFASETLRARLPVRQRQAVEKLEGMRRAGPHVPTSEMFRRCARCGTAGEGARGGVRA